MAKTIVITEAELTSQLAEGMHTAFRKASDYAEAGQIWKLIHDLAEQGEWSRVCAWVASGIALNFTQDVPEKEDG